MVHTDVSDGLKNLCVQDELPISDC